MKFCHKLYKIKLISIFAMVESKSKGFGDFSDLIDCILEPESGIGGLYISSQSAAQDKKKMKNSNITSVLTVARGLGMSFDKKKFTHKVIPAEDAEIFNIAPFFDEGVEFIRENLKTRNVLVHCKAGMSRSTTLVLAYLLAEKRIRFDEALAYAKSRRTRIAGPNSGFAKQLRTYEQQLLKAIELKKTGTNSEPATNTLIKTENSIKGADSKNLEVASKVIIEERIKKDADEKEK